MKTQLCYVTDDGKSFVDKDMAEKHQLHLDLIEWANKVGLCRGGEWSADMVIHQILEDSNHLGKLLGPAAGLCYPEDC